MQRIILFFVVLGLATITPPTITPLFGQADPAQPQAVKDAAKATAKKLTVGHIELKGS